MKIILCATPFHIFSAINISSTYLTKEKIIVVILNYFSGSNELYNRLKESGLFYKVCFINVTKMNYMRYCNNKLYRLFYMINSSWIVREIDEDLAQVDEVIFPYLDPVLLILGKEIQKKNIKCKYSYFEDGTASYIGDFESLLPARLELFFRVPLRIYVPNYIYSYSPAIYSNRSDFKVYPLFIESMEKINQIFDYVHKEMKYKILFLDTGIGWNDEADICINLLNCVFDKEMKEKILVKKHPNRTDEKYENAGYGIYCSQKGTPFEICILNDEQIADSILISDFSTACFSPKLIAEKEPVLIFLYKIIENGVFSDRQKLQFDLLVEQFTKLYQDKTKIIVPRNIDEFRKVILSYEDKTNY